MRPGQAVPERLQPCTENACLVRSRQEPDRFARQLGSSAGAISLEAADGHFELSGRTDLNPHRPSPSATVSHSPSPSLTVP